MLKKIKPYIIPCIILSFYIIVGNIEHSSFSALDPFGFFESVMKTIVSIIYSIFN